MKYQFTVWTVEPALAWKFEPVNVALTVLEPAGSAELERVAVVPLTLTDPRVVPPEVNVTVPDGVAPVLDLMVALKVTLWPRVEALGEETAVVVVGARPTIWLRTGEVLGAKLVSPLYFAVIDFAPAANVEIVRLAAPLDIVTRATVVVPDRKVIVPLGVPE